MEVERFKLLRGYCRWQSPQQLVDLMCQEAGLLTPGSQAAFMHTCYHNDTCRKCPPSSDYRRRLLQTLVKTAECQEQEVEEEVMQALQHLLLSGCAEEDSVWGYKTYFIASDRIKSKGTHMDAPISLRLSPNMLEGSTGCYQWEAGFLLGQFILSNPGLFQGKHCLELGCGSGLCGVCLSRVGAKAVTLTDGSRDTVENCRHTLEINHASFDMVKVDCQLYQWGVIDADCLEADVIVGADLLYDPGGIDALVQTLAYFLQMKPRGSKLVYLATCKRNPTTHDLFLSTARQAGLKLDVVANLENSFDYTFYDALDATSEDLSILRLHL